MTTWEPPDIDFDPLPTQEVAGCDIELRLFLMYACRGSVQVYVWARGFEDAFEELVDWLDDNGKCGCFTFLNIDDLKEAAKDLGIPWDPDWPDYQDGAFNTVVEHAEADLTLIGHTTLKCGKSKGSAYMTSDEWGGHEVDDAEEIALVQRLTMSVCYDHVFLEGDYVWLNDPEGAGKYVVAHVNGDSVDLEPIEPHDNDRYSNVSVEEIEFFDPAKHYTKRWADPNDWAAQRKNESDFDGLGDIDLEGREDLFEERFVTPAGTRVYMFVYFDGQRARYHLELHRPGRAPQEFEDYDAGSDLYEGVVSGRRRLIKELRPKRLDLASLGKRRRR